jgi:ATP-dependent Lhr-like helicase
MTIPPYLNNWFAGKGWRMHPYQKKMFIFARQKKSVLLIAPTGGGKTLASFLPSLVDIHNKKFKGLHTLYISPLKALAADIQRNLQTPISGMHLDVSVDMRTGDTSSYRRIRQRKKPPAIILTTPESLMLLLSYPDAEQFFGNLQTIIVDELHTFAPTKRGDLLTLGLAQLAEFAPAAIRIGLSATVADPEILSQWLGTKNHPSQILIAKTRKPPHIELLDYTANIPYSGFMARYAVEKIYSLLQNYKLTIVFVNTRAQAEFVFQQLWRLNRDNLPIAVYHGSLSKEQRTKTETLIVAQKIKAVVATSALELGIDWGNIDCVLQIGAPRGISRLLQRIGRSNHQFDKASFAKLVPANCFDTIECQAAIDAINQGKLDSEPLVPGSLDVVVQFIINCACSHEIDPEKIFRIVTNAYPYYNLQHDIFLKLFEFAQNGGYVLKHYEQYHRLVATEEKYVIASDKFARRHRQNIGTIIESARLYIKVVNKRKDKVLGNIEEGFIQQLSPGDTFLFAGLVLEFIRVHDMFVEVRKIKSKEAKLPSYLGGTLPLTTCLAEEVRALINTPSRWQVLPEKVYEWLMLQKRFSALPDNQTILIEHYIYKKSFYLTIYSFEGRRANHTLGMLITKRMEALKLLPVSFTATDYGLAIRALKPIGTDHLEELLSPNIISSELEKWLSISPLLKRSFRQVAIISGLVERQQAGKRKTLKQVTFSTDLLYDVLQRHEPNHILLTMTRVDADRILLDLDRLQNMLKRFENKINFIELAKPSPMSISFLTTFKTENVEGDALQELLRQNQNELLATALMAEVRNSVKSK